MNRRKNPKDGTDVNSIMRDLMSIIPEGALDQEMDEDWDIPRRITGIKKQIIPETVISQRPYIPVMESDQAYHQMFISIFWCWTYKNRVSKFSFVAWNGSAIDASPMFSQSLLRDSQSACLLRSDNIPYFSVSLHFFKIQRNLDIRCVKEFFCVFLHGKFFQRVGIPVFVFDYAFHKWRLMEPEAFQTVNIFPMGGRRGR